MGRMYTGDIEGKFWFGIQPSNDAERFGAHENSVISYGVDDNDECRERLQEIFTALGLREDFAMNADELYTLARNDADQSDERAKLYGSRRLGLKIYQCVERQSYCYFEAKA